MADAAVSMALQTLYDLLVEEGKFLVNVSNQVEEVKRELNTMHCFLKDADNWPDRYNSETVRNWVAELKDLACDAEDVLEKYAVKVTSRREGKNLKKVVKRFICIFSECLSVHEVGNEIEAIRTRMANLTRRLENIVKADSSAAAADDNQRQLRQTYAHQVEEHFVGMQDDIGRLVSLAVSDDRANRVISICGMGGLGKTTLARKIYKHEDVERVFQARAWVCLTQQFETKTVLQRILKQLDSSARNQELMEMDENELVVQLYYVQMTKKCLVIIDDIWTVDHWDIMRPAFPVVEGSCKVLLTTRNEQIAAECVYKLGYLTEDQCWELLQKIALPQASVRAQCAEVTHESKELEDIGRDLIHKCGCLPLAISVIGGILREKQSVGEWKKVKANFDKCVQYGDGTEKERRVAQVLDLSYNALPYHLKPCFLYLGIYSEDEEIDAEKVLLQWMAEGMISSETQGTEETLRDVAQRYLSELASRCMVQVKVLEYPSLHKRFESCRLHDLMRDLCLTKAKEEGFLENMDFYFPKDYCSSTIKTRRLAIHFQGDVGDDFNGIEKLTNLRCLYIDNKLKYPKVCDIGYHNLVSNLDKFKSLRVLILVSCDLREGIIPSDIGYKLIHLRYLGFRDCLLDELPLSITNFPYLQTLELEIYHGSHTKIPNVLYKMRRLKHLFLQYVQPYEEQLYGEYLRLDGLNELETFDEFKTIYYDPSDIPKLTNLRYFKAFIINESSLSVLVNHISDSKTKLCETILNIANCDFGSEEGSALLRKMLVSPSLARVLIDGRICRLPSCEPDDRLCPSLVDLTLCFSVIENDPMEILERLPMLKKLRLLDQAFVGSKMVCHASGFPQLRYLLLAGLPHLEEWKVEEGAMPNLSTIVIFNCGRLKMIPNGLRFITSLQKLQIVSMPKEFEDRLQKVDGEQGEDYDKVSHISSILFGGDFDYETWLNYK